MHALPARKPVRRKVLAAILAGCALSLALVFHFVVNPARSDPAPLAAHTTQETVGLPVRLKIPSIKVDATIEHVGLTPDGAMDVPKDPVNAAWFDRGPRPGEKGSSVIDGHFGTADGSPAVFDDLHELDPGDKLYVEDEKGTTTLFVVRELRKYDPDADASSVFSSRDGRAHLNLITCIGTWNTAEQSYSDRLVVFTDKEMRFKPAKPGGVVHADKLRGYDIAWFNS